MNKPGFTIDDLLEEYDRALAYTDSLWLDLDDTERDWRPHDLASAIGWHVGHQAAVAHFMVRNLTAAEALIDPELDSLMDSATPEPDRGSLPDRDRLIAYRRRVVDRVRFRMTDIRDGNVGAPVQLASVATGLLTAVINHDYQHSKWIGEVRSDALGLPLPPLPASVRLAELDGYVTIGA
jgi:hypothetical protein